jgi:hypothetical protein
MKNMFNLKVKLMFGLSVVSLSMLSACTNTELSVEELMKVSEDGNPNRLFEQKGTVRYENNATGDYTKGLKYVTATDGSGNNVCSVAYGDATETTYIKLPDTYVDDAGTVYTITSIANNAFSNIDFVSISQWPTNLTVMGKQAFTHSNFTSFTFPSGPTEIFPGTFEDCKDLTYFSFADTSIVTKIWDHAFAGCDYLGGLNDGTVGNFKLPNGLIEICSSAFSYCTYLQDIIIPTTVTTIRENAFYHCESVVYIHIPNISTVTIEKYAFRGISGAEIYLQADAIPTTYNTDWNRIGNKTGTSTDSTAYLQVILSIDAIGTENDFIYISQGEESYITRYVGYGTAITIPATIGGKPVVEVRKESFYYNNKITSVDMSAATSLTIIGEDAFNNCTALTTVTFPSSLITIKKEAFLNCTAITGLKIPKSVVTIEDSAFQNTYKVASLEFEGASTNTSNLASIGTNAFNSCGKGITPTKNVELIIPSSLMDNTGTTSYYKRIGNNAFQNCNFFTTLTFKDAANATLASTSATKINDNAFDSCTNLSKINWGNWVNELGGNIFGTCQKLPYVYIPLSINKIDGSIASNSMLTIYFEGATGSYGKIDGNAQNQGSSYNGAPFSSLKNGIYYNIGAETNIMRETTQGYYYIFDDATKKENTKEPNGNHITITGYVKTNAFLGLTANAATIKVAETHVYNGNSYTVTEIGQGAFAGDTSVKKFELPNTISFIGLSGFYACNNTLQIVGYTGTTYNANYVFPTSLAYICDNGLMKTKLTYVVLPTAVDIYFPDANYYVNKAPDTSTAARLNVFCRIEDCRGFSLGTAYNSAELVGTNLTSYDGCLYVNSSRTTCNQTVLYCIPRAKTTFSTYSGCNITGMDLFKNSPLTTINFNNGLISMYGWAFQDSGSLTTITLPTSLKYVSNSTFDGCGNLANFKSVDTAGTTSNASTILNFVDDKTTRTGNILSIGEAAFRNCAYTGVVLPISTNISISSEAFGNGTDSKKAYIYVSDKYADFVALHYADTSTNKWVNNVWNKNTKETIYYAETTADKTQSTVRYWHYVDGAPVIW